MEAYRYIYKIEEYPLPNEIRVSEFDHFEDYHD